MSKNTGTSELINYFDLGANGDVGIAGSLDVNTIANATTDTDRFLVSDTGIIKYRTGAELLSDIGAQGLLTNPVTGTGTSGTIPVFTGSTTIGNSIIQSNATQVNVVGNGSSLLFDSLGQGKSGGIQYTNDFELLVYNSRGTGSYITLGNTNLDFNTNTSGNPKLRITDGGNVLIGTTTDAGFKLDVNGTGRFSGALTANNLIVKNSGVPAAQFYRDLDVTIVGPAGQGIEIGARSGSTFIAGGAIYASLFNPATTGDLIFQTLNGGTLGTRLTIASTGTATFSGYSGAVNQNNGIKLTNNVGTIVGLEVGGSNDSYIGTISASNFSIRTANTPILTVSSGGNVLIGTTTDNGARLQVSGGDITIANTTTTALRMNASSSSFQTTIYLQEGGATRWEFGKSSSTPNFYFYSYGTSSEVFTLNYSTGAATFRGNINLPSGTNRSITLGSVSNYNYVLRTDGDDFVITEAGVTDRLRYSYTNVRWTITGGLTVSGSLSKGSGSFKIDHPLPEKKDTHQLVHSFIEGPQADNIYRGKVKLVDGYAEVNIDEVSKMTEGTFVLLNGNVQCFTSNESGWTSIKGRIDSNMLIIESEDFNCTDTVSWLVVGERHDQHMIDTDWTDENGKVIVEPLKK
jgi:hypothetical protein